GAVRGGKGAATALPPPTAPYRLLPPLTARATLPASRVSDHQPRSPLLEPGGRTRTDSPSPRRGRRRRACTVRCARGSHLSAGLPPRGRRRARPGVHPGHLRPRLRAAGLLPGRGQALDLAPRRGDVRGPERAAQGETVPAAR